MAVFIIAEAGVNHNGRLDLALKLCDEAKNAGVHAVKFQTWKTELVITKGTKKASYQEENLSNADDQYEMLKKLEMSYKNFRIVKQHCENIGVQFLSTADETESLDFLVDLGMSYIKLGSGDITNIPFLRYAAKKNLPIILSTGMSYLADVDIAYRTLVEYGAKSVSLLHCTTNYPCPMEEVNLRAMLTLKEAFKCPVGYSDHSMGIEVPVAAVAMGAEIIEKHFTLDKTMDGPDHKASLEPAELKAMVDAIRNIEVALGDGIKQPNPSEKEISSVVLKRIVAKTPIQAGEKFCSNNLDLKRSSYGITAQYWDLVVGRKASKNFDINEPIEI
jgi:N,N'-diacetyllegionaminate synthase